MKRQEQQQYGDALFHQKNPCRFVSLLFPESTTCLRWTVPTSSVVLTKDYARVTARPFLVHTRAAPVRARCYTADMPELPYAELIAAVVAMVYAIAIFSAVEAVMTVRTAQGAIAWSISLLTLPYLTVPLYLIFGRNRFDGYIEQRSEIEAETERLSEDTLDAIGRHTAHGDRAFPIYGSLARLAPLPATGGNEVQLLVDGQVTFASIMQGLESATRYILLQSFIIRDDNLGARIGEILSRKASAGVRVFLLYDEIGCRRFTRTTLYRRLQRAGVRSAPFNTTQGRRNRLQLNFRNHRKIIGVDGSTAWVGGHNIGDEYLGLGRRGAWRDTHLRLRGPAVMGTELAFATDWRWATRMPVEVDWQFRDEHTGDCNVLVFPSDPASDFEEAGLMYHQVISSAHDRIWIASPYFVPDRGIISALQLAALRGVDVRVMIPDHVPTGPWSAWPTGPLPANSCRRVCMSIATGRAFCTRRSFSWTIGWRASARQTSTTARSG